MSKSSRAREKVGLEELILIEFINLIAILEHGNLPDDCHAKPNVLGRSQ